MRPFALLLVACCAVHAHAQELVPNGGLEDHTTCPDAMGQLDRATGWAPPTTGSTDYLNACQAAANSVGVPANLFGEQAAHGGQGYAGFLAFSGPENTGPLDDHEYLTHALATPLVPGQWYTVSFYVSLAEVSKYAINDLGALLSVQPPHRADMLSFTATPQVMNTSLAMLDDENGWTRIQGCVQADSAYAYITVGNFHVAEATVYEVVSPDAGSWFTYYYVDDVSVQPVPQPDLGLGPDRTICAATTLAVADPQPGADYVWNTGATGPSIMVDAGGTYSVEVANAECPLADTVVIQFGLPVTLGLPADTLVDLCATPQVRLDARPRPPDASLLWSTGAAGPTLVVDAPGTYLVQAEAPDRCAASASIAVIDTCTTPVYAPNAFTPNGDGINDNWRPIWRANPGATLAWTIYDRWGRAVFSATDANNAWDGTAGGSPVPSGTYAWRGQALDPAVHLALELTGHVVVVVR